LAVALARKGLRVALVEGNLRHPGLHDQLGLNNDVGLTTIIEGKALEMEVEEDGLAVEEIIEMDPDDEDSVFAALQRAINANLFVLTSGPICDSPIAALEGSAMEATIKTLSRIMDYVVIDTPSVERGGESLALAALSDACVMVVASGECESGEALWAKSLFTNVQTSVLGVVLNKCSKNTSRRFELAGWEEENSESVNFSG
jgi:receptor protein-tyrosine kinase